MATVGPFDFSKGFSTGYRFNAIPLGFANEMKNCRFKNGAIVPRWSQKQTNSATLGTSKYVTGLTSWIDAANSVIALVATCNAKIYTADATSYLPSSSALTFTDRTGATTVTATNSLRYTFDSLNGILIVAGNSAAGGVPLKVTAYNTNAANLGGTPPKADCVKVVNNFAFLGRQLNSSTTYSTLNWSNVSDPETWTAGNALEINKKDGEQIMALGAIGADLYIFKQSTIWRLSTITQTTSGAVTLGPLQVVVKGIGCCGPLALDNLPNGNIVFVGYDGHFYEFNGSTVVDRSRTPYPGVDVFSDGEVGRGLSSAVANTQTVVKTWRGINEVWIGYDSTATGVSTDNVLFAYDFDNQIWQGHISDTFPKTFATIPIAGSISANIYESSEILFHGNASGNIFAHGDFSKQYPVDESAVATDCRVGTCLSLGKQASDFVPRSVCFETSDTGTNLAGLTLYATNDAAFSGGSGLVTFVGASPARCVVGLTMKQDSATTNVLPSLLSLEWIATFSGTSATEAFRLGKFYVSDEIVR